MRVNLDPESCYRALLARDVRYDGRFFVGVTTTGIYCRPICPARTPGRDRCRYFSLPASAEVEGFRPCLRCRPELAPGEAPVDAAGRIAAAAVRRISAGALDEGGVEALARGLGLSARQLRRILHQQYGVTPIDLAQTHRLLLTRRLILETDVPITEVAFAGGYQSIRRFNAAFRARYRQSPSALRRRGSASPSALCLRLAYRPPLAWDPLMQFLAGRAIPGVEIVDADGYARTVRIGTRTGWLRVQPDPERNEICLRIDPGLLRELATVVARVRQVFDLDADPEAIGACLDSDGVMHPLNAATPGIRVPGAWDGFETAIRAVLGQQVSVRSASTIAGRLAAVLGEAVETPIPGLCRLSPTSGRLAEASVDELCRLGMTRSRAATLRAVAAAVEGGLDLTPSPAPEKVTQCLLALPGIGDWTARYVAMRCLRDPDAFPAGDLALRRAMGNVTETTLRAGCERWRPWRAYAAMLLWHSLRPEPGTNRGTDE